MMKPLLKSAAVAMLTAACTHTDATPAAAPSRRGHLGPEDAVRAYFRASDEGSARLLRSAFHPSAHMQWVDRDTGALRALTQLAWWERLDTAAAPPSPATERHLTVLDREGRLALVEAVSRWPTHTFNDLLLVVDTPEGFLIVGKVFQRIDAGGQATAAPEGSPEEDVRAVLAGKIEAHAAYSPSLLHRTHTAECPYYRVNIGGVPFARVSLSEAAARYAAKKDAGEQDRESQWRVLKVEVRGNVAAAKLDVIFEGARYIDHLLLVRAEGAWRIAAAAWGSP